MCVRACPRYCSDCKKYLDRIYNQAKNQQQMTWWKQARSCEKQAREMLGQYRKMLGEVGPSAKRVKINVAELREVVTRQQRQTVSNKGRLMWMREAIEFWQTTLGGALSLEAAEAAVILHG